jgi:hypothetical protein
MARFLGTFLVAVVAVSLGQRPSLKPAPVRATLNQVVGTLSSYPQSPDTAETIAALRKSALWLAGRLKDDKTPEAYGRSVERSLELLRAALDSGPLRQAETLQYIFQDLTLKHADCKQFGMGRLVKLKVRTLKGNSEDKGWQVFYRWLPARAVGEVRPQPFPSLSSPTSVELPPGAYTIQARRTIDGREVATTELPVPVGGARSVDFEVPVP